MTERFATTNGGKSCDALPFVAAKPAHRLVLFAPNLHGGGAERTLARLATHWARQGREVTLVTLAAASPEDFPLPPNVSRVSLGLTAESTGPLGALRNNLGRVRALRDTFRATRPDVVVSFIEQANVLALLAARPLGVPVVISERTDPERHPVSRLWSFLRRRTYPRCAALVVLTDEIAEAMRPLVRGREIVVIPNGVAKPETSRDDERSTTILAVGRLDPAKGFDRLIAAFGRIAGRHPGWNLVVLGEGQQRGELEQAISANGLTERVRLMGRVADPSEWFDRAAVFALPSRYEGFPNALLEAMARSLPAVAFDGPAAVRQVIRDGIDGRLVPDGNVPAFAAALEELMAKNDRRQEMGQAARDVLNRFGLDPFYTCWDAVLDRAAGREFSQPLGSSRE